VPRGGGGKRRSGLDGYPFTNWHQDFAAVADGATFTSIHDGTFTRLGDKLINHCDAGEMRAVKARVRTEVDREAWWDQEAASMAERRRYLAERALQPVTEEEELQQSDQQEVPSAALAAD
jgi:hypothetical protein